MKIKMRKKVITVYEVEIEGKCVGGFRIDSECEGLKLLKSDSGLIVVDDAATESVFDFLQSDCEYKEVDVIMISPSLLARAQKKESEEQNGK